MIRKTGRFIVASLLLVGVLSGCGKSEREIAGFDDAAQAKIGVMTGAIGETIAAQRFPQAQRKSFDDIMDAVAAMKSGQIEAIITAYPTALQLVKTNPDLKRLPEPLDNEDTAIALRKSDGELLAQVDRVIGELKDEGTLADMKKRWFKTDTAPYEDAQIALPKDGKALRVGVSATREPFSFVDKNGRVSGHDGELARRIGERLQRPVEFLDMKFMALIPALQSGKIDLIVTGMTATDERKKSVDFSKKYYYTPGRLVMKAGSEVKDPLVDLKGKKVGVQRATIFDRYATDVFAPAGIEVVRYASQEEVFLDLVAGRIDASLADAVSIQFGFLQTDAGKGFATVGPAFTDRKYFGEGIGVAVRKGDTALVEKFNAAIDAIRANGKYQQIAKKYFDFDIYGE